MQQQKARTHSTLCCSCNRRQFTQAAHPPRHTHAHTRAVTVRPCCNVHGSGHPPLFLRLLPCFLGTNRNVGYLPICTPIHPRVLLAASLQAPYAFLNSVGYCVLWFSVGVCVCVCCDTAIFSGEMCPINKAKKKKRQVHKLNVSQVVCKKGLGGSVGSVRQARLQYTAMVPQPLKRSEKKMLDSLWLLPRPECDQKGAPPEPLGLLPALAPLEPKEALEAFVRNHASTRTKEVIQLLVVNRAGYNPNTAVEQCMSGISLSSNAQTFKMPFSMSSGTKQTEPNWQDTQRFLSPCSLQRSVAEGKPNVPTPSCHAQILKASRRPRSSAMLGKPCLLTCVLALVAIIICALVQVCARYHKSIHTRKRPRPFSRIWASTQASTRSLRYNGSAPRCFISAGCAENATHIPFSTL